MHCYYSIIAYFKIFFIILDRKTLTEKDKVMVIIPKPRLFLIELIFNIKNYWIIYTVIILYTCLFSSIMKLWKATVLEKYSF